MKRWAAWLARHELWPVLLGGLLASAGIKSALWGLLILLALCLARRMGCGYWSLSTPLGWPGAVLLGMGLVAWGVTADREATFLAFSRLVAGLSLAYSVINWAQEPARFNLLWLGLALGALLLAGAAPLVIPWQAPIIPQALYARVPRLFDAPLNPNMVAGALVLLLPFPLALLVLAGRDGEDTIEMAQPGWSRRRWLRWLVAVPALLGVMVTLTLTWSRGGWLAALAAVFVVGLGYSWRLLWGAVLPLLGLGWLLWRGELAAFLDLLGSGGAVSGWAERVEIWSRALYMIQDFPFTGIGANTYPAIVALLYPLFLTSPDKVIPHAHNLLLQVAVDLGIPGLVAFLAILILAFVCGVRVLRFYRRDGGRNDHTALTWACLASLVAMLVHGLVDATSWIIGWGAPLPWAVIGILVALERNTWGEERP